MLDGHTHILEETMNRDAFLESAAECDLEGGIIISLPPARSAFDQQNLGARERIDNLLYWTGNDPKFYPFFWIDPMDDDALEQVDVAVGNGVKGFKVVCRAFSPGHRRAIEIFNAIALKKMPILFHSGILRDGAPSSMYNRPAEFEALLKVDGIRFCLAHVSWPWYDESIAVYGKFMNARSLAHTFKGEMFVDISPGMPPIYRRDVLTKLMTVGYDVANNVIFGSDSCVNKFDCAAFREIVDRDNAIYSEIGLDDQRINSIFSQNLKRFVEGV